MNINQLKRLIPLAHKANVTLRVVGHHGEGKTQSIKQAAKEGFDGNVVVIMASQNDVGDLIGLADFTTDSKGNKTATKFFKPNWWPRDANSKGIIFLDEFSRGRIDVQQAMFQLALDRELHGDKLPEGWTVVVADNPDSDDYKTEQMDDKALLDRFLHVKFQPKNAEFFDFAKDANFDTDLLTFLQQHEEVLVNPKLKDFTIDRQPSKRSWHAVARLMEIGIDEDMFLETIGGMVGYENASRFKAYLEKNRAKPFTGEQLLNDFSKIKKEFKQYADFTSGRHQLLSLSSDSLVDYLYTLDTLTDKQVKNLNEFLEYIPVDIGFSFFMKTYLGEDKNGKKMCSAVNDALNANVKWDDLINNKPTSEVKTNDQ